MNKVILLIPHYNNVHGLQNSLRSIHKDEKVDVMIVDDGSNQKIDENKIREVFVADGEVFFEYLKRNKGIEHALNKGLKCIQKMNYPYIARLDCGDICQFKRFNIQELFLEKNNNIALVGSDVDFIDLKGKHVYTLKLPYKDRIIKKKMYLSAMHIHPTIMFRSIILDKIGLYPTKYKAVEDYAFFFNIIKHYKVANIDKVLVKCEINDTGISSVLRNKQARNRIKVILDNFYFGFYPIYGLLRGILLYILPLKFLIKLKKIIKN